MTWKQTRSVKVNVPCTPGYCLTYVQDVFGIPAKQPSALADWNANTFNHEDKNFPNVATPVWFTGKSGALKEYGHVAVRMADGSVWSCSHPTENEPMHFPSIDALNRYYSGQLVYLGWTEDVEDVLVMKETKGMTTQERHDVGTAVYRATLRREPENGAAAVAMGKRLEDSNGNLTPKSVIAGLQSVPKSTEWKSLTSDGKLAKVKAAVATLNNVLK